MGTPTNFRLYIKCVRPVCNVRGKEVNEIARLMTALSHERAQEANKPNLQPLESSASGRTTASTVWPYTFQCCHQTTCTKRFLNFGVPVETKHSVSGCCNLEEAGCLCPSQRGVQAGAHHLLPTPGFAWPSHCSLQENSRDKVCFQNQGFRACIPTPTCVVPALTANSD